MSDDEEYIDEYVNLIHTVKTKAGSYKPQSLVQRIWSKFPSNTEPNNNQCKYSIAGVNNQYKLSMTNETEQVSIQ